eukprot:9850021-Ditylum_brightwellii.AAC.1
MAADRISSRPVLPVPKTGNSKALKHAAKAASKKKNAPQAEEIKVTKEIAYKVTKETNASAGPEVTKEIKASENKVTKEPPGLVEKDSPQEPPPPFEQSVLSEEEGPCYRKIIPEKNELAKKIELARKNAQPSDLSNDNKPLSTLEQKARGFQEYMD